MLISKSKGGGGGGGGGGLIVKKCGHGRTTQNRPKVLLVLLDFFVLPPRIPVILDKKCKNT